MAYETSRSAVLKELWIAFATLALLGVASAALGMILSLSGSIRSVAMFLGSSDPVDGWLIVLFFGTVAGALFIVGLNLVSELVVRTGRTSEIVYNPIAGVLIGMTFGLALWVIGVAVGVPIVVESLIGQQRPFPYAHYESLAGIMVYSVLIGVGYPVVRWWERDMMVYYDSESNPTTGIDADYEPTDRDEAVLEALQDGRETGAPWGRANARWLREETGIGKRDTQEALENLQRVGWIREVSGDCYEFMKDPRAD